MGAGASVRRRRCPATGSRRAGPPTPADHGAASPSPDADSPGTSTDAAPEPEDRHALAEGARAALDAAEILGEALCTLRAELAAEVRLSRPAVRRAESAVLELEELLEEASGALVALVLEEAWDPASHRKLVLERCREMLGTWESGLESEKARKSDCGLDVFAPFVPRLVDALEAIVSSLYPGRKGRIESSRRAERERRRQARTDLPVM